MSERITRLQVNQTGENQWFKPFSVVFSALAEAGLQKLERIRLAKALEDTQKLEDFLDKVDPKN